MLSRRDREYTDYKARTENLTSKKVVDYKDLATIRALSKNGSPIRGSSKVYCGETEDEGIYLLEDGRVVEFQSSHRGMFHHAFTWDNLEDYRNYREALPMNIYFFG